MCYLFIKEFLALRHRYLGNATLEDEVAATMSAAYVRDLLKTTKKSYTFIHLDAVDGAGHENGWCSEGYYEQVATADRQVVLNHAVK